MEQSGGDASQFGIAFVAIAPVLGHAWSPFLKFKGGKALAASWGSWIALTSGTAIPVALLLLGLLHILQRNHAVTVTFCLLGFLPIFLPFLPHAYLAAFWLANLIVLIYKHRTEYASGIRPRKWVRKVI